MESCLSVFARYGYANASTEKLAEAAGISKALIFHHFGSKKKLYFDLLEHCATKIATELRFNEVFEQQSFFEAIHQLARMELDYCRKHPDEYRLLHDAFSAAPDELKGEVEAMFGQALAARNEKLERLFESVPLRQGVDRKEAFELVMVTAKHFEHKFVTEFQDIRIDDEYADNLLDELERFHSMICHGIAR
jgi:AcrR family transcriptional regulator